MARKILKGLLKEMSLPKDTPIIEPKLAPKLTPIVDTKVTPKLTPIIEPIIAPKVTSKLAPKNEPIDEPKLTPIRKLKSKPASKEKHNVYVEKKLWRELMEYCVAQGDQTEHINKAFSLYLKQLRKSNKED